MLDVLYERMPFVANSIKVLETVFRGEHVGIIPVHTVTTIHYSIAKHLTYSKANESVDWLLENFTIATADGTILRRARNINSRDFEDAVVIATAEAANCDIIITRNSKDFDVSTKPALTPQQFMETHHSDN